MSDKNALPPELAALEQALSRPRGLPDPAMRDRVLAAVGQELASCRVQHPQASTLGCGTLTARHPPAVQGASTAQPARPAPAAMPTWQYLAALAAGVLLALNASVVFTTSGRNVTEAPAAVVVTADDLKMATELGLSERDLRLSLLAVPVGRAVPEAAYRPCVLPKDLMLE